MATTQQYPQGQVGQTQGVIDQQPRPIAKEDNLNDWIERLNNTLKDPSHITQPQGTAEWSSGFFECFNPIDTCLMTYFCPCVTFGKTAHRLRNNGDTSSWSPVNTACLIWWGSTCFGAHCVPTLIQRGEIRKQSQLQLKGDFVTDLLKAWCCHCCDLIQQDKEAERLMANDGGVVMQEPGKAGGMNYPA